MTNRIEAAGIMLLGLALFGIVAYAVLDRLAFVQAVCAQAAGALR